MIASVFLGRVCWSGDILNMNEINKFRLLKTDRSERYQSFDLMAQDSRIASIFSSI